MTTSIDKAKIREIVLELIRTDEEFRLTIAGAIGLQNILEELKRIHEDIRKLWLKSLEHDKRFEVIERKLLEYDKRFEEMNKRFEAIEKKLLEHDKRFESIERKLLEHDKRFEAIERKLLEHDKRFDEINRRISRLELGLAALTESFYSKSILEDLRARASARGEKIIGWERNARVDESDIDLLIETDKSVYVVEVKVKPKHEDVGGLLAKLDVVKKKYPGKNVVGVLAGAMIGREVKEYALRKNILVYAY